MVERLFLAVPRGCLQFVIAVFPDHTHLLFCIIQNCLENHFQYLKCLIQIIDSILIYNEKSNQITLQTSILRLI